MRIAVLLLSISSPLIIPNWCRHRRRSRYCNSTDFLCLTYGNSRSQWVILVVTTIRAHFNFVSICLKKLLFLQLQIYLFNVLVNFMASFSTTRFRRQVMIVFVCITCSFYIWACQTECLMLACAFDLYLIVRINLYSFCTSNITPSNLVLHLVDCTTSHLVLFFSCGFT